MPDPVSEAAHTLDRPGGLWPGELAMLGEAWAWRGGGDARVLHSLLARLEPAQLWHVSHDEHRRAVSWREQEWHGLIEAGDLGLIHRSEVVGDPDVVVEWDGKVLAIESVRGLTILVPLLGIWEELFWAGNEVSAGSKLELTKAVVELPRRAAGVGLSLLRSEAAWLEAAGERPETGGAGSRGWDALMADAQLLARGLRVEEVGMIEALASEWERSAADLVAAARAAMAPSRCSRGDHQTAKRADVQSLSAAKI